MNDESDDSYRGVQENASLNRIVEGGPLHLLNVHTHVLEDFTTSTPRYTILSHTWGADEVTFDDWQQGL